MSADFVARMEDVLDLYSEPCDPHRPVVCFDETYTQLLSDAREPSPAMPGRPRREDYEYRRQGTRNLFLFIEPLAGWRHMKVTERRTVSDFRKDHLAALPGLFLQVPVFCQRAGLVKLGHAALDGTKVRANASKHKAMSYKRTKEQEAQLQGEVDEEEDCRSHSRMKVNDSSPRRRMSKASGWMERRRPRYRKRREARLCRRIRNHIKELFVFVAHPEVPPDNNAAERSLRPVVVSRKVSGGTRSAAGTDTKMALASSSAPGGHRA